MALDDHVKALQKAYDKLYLDIRRMQVSQKLYADAVRAAVVDGYSVAPSGKGNPILVALELPPLSIWLTSQVFTYTPKDPKPTESPD